MGAKSNDVRFDAKGPLFQALGVDLTLIEGIDVGTALVILAEIGVDVSRFPTEKHFASWLRLCPPQNESNKTKKRRGHRKGDQPSHHRLAAGRAVGGQDNDAAGPVLPPDPQSDRRTWSGQGDRAQVGVFGLQDAQVRPRVRDPVDGRVRGQDEGQPVEVAAAKGGGDGLPTESAAQQIDESTEAVAIARQACWLRTTLRNQLLGRPFAMLGVWGKLARRRLRMPPTTVSIISKCRRLGAKSSWGVVSCQ